MENNKIESTGTVKMHIALAVGDGAEEVRATNEAKPCKRKYNMLGKATGELDIPTGQFAVSFIDVQGSDNMLNYPIIHIYKQSNTEFGCGRNMRLNLHEKLQRISDDSAKSDFVYTDALGKEYMFKEYFYYIDSNGVRQDVSKENVSIALDGTLKYGSYEAHKEVRSATGLTIITSFADSKLKNVELYEERQSETKQLEDQVNSYQKTFEKFSLVDKNTGEEEYKLRDYCGTYEKFNEFIEKANEQGTNLIVLYDSEIPNYKTLIVSGSGPYADYLQNKKGEYTDELQTYYKDYANVSEELAKRLRYTPVNFIIDGQNYKGFNKYGDLVAIGDSYGNTLAIERNDRNRIVKVRDNSNNTVLFNYNSRDILTSVTDMHGRRTEFIYKTYGNSYGSLELIRYSDGKEICMDMTDNKLNAVIETGVESYGISYDNSNRVKKIVHDIYFDKIEHGKISNEFMNVLPNESITYDTVRFMGENVGQTVVTTYGDITVKDIYRYDESGNLLAYYREEAGKLVQAEKYDYEQFGWDNVQYAPKEMLEQNDIDTLEFVGGEFRSVSLDQFNLPKNASSGGKKINVNGEAGKSTEESTVSFYYYDDNHRLKREETSVYTTVTSLNGNPVETAYKNVKLYNYNAHGNVVRIESYVENKGEGNVFSFDDSLGRTIEEHVYDDNGHEIKSFIYNSLDTSSKFYTESGYDKNGKVIAEIDETGENKTELEYIDGASSVRTRTFPNGGKFAVGHAADGTVSAITQSTDEGEENSTQIGYTCGEITELRSGNNVVRYAYDHKRRKTAVELNGKEYVRYTYADNVIENGKTVNKATATYAERTLADGTKTQEVFTTIGDLQGKTLETKYGDTALTSVAYDSRDRVAKITDGISNAETSFTYDDLDRVTCVNAGDVVETTVFDDYGLTRQKTVAVGGKETKYVYSYKSGAAKDLDSITVGNITVKPQSDCLGRNTGKEVTFNEKKISEHIAYRKVGDHATNMPSSMRFGDMRGGKFVMTDNIKYKYDERGNISEVWENGLLSAKYTYDKLDRLIREDNRGRERTWIYAYDNNGNLLSRRMYYFNLTETKSLEAPGVNGVCGYDGDRLMYYGDERFVYDSLGNPTTYRGKAAKWTRGRMLASYNGVAFAYDGRGRRTGKSAGNKTVSFTYDGSGNLIKQSNGLEFLYDHSGIMGVKYNNATYLYRKDAQGNIIALLDSNGNIVVRYVYDAWGNQSVKIADGTAEAVQETHIGNLNPFRYRGYYYDTETGLYYLKTRYYDPEIGRFMTIDGIGYLDSTTVNGLNLYAYCGNNPVMAVDPEGTSWWDDFKFRLKVGASATWNNFKREVSNTWNGLLDGLHKLPDRIGKTIGAIVENTSASGGVGIGLGFGFNILNFFGFSALYKADFFNIGIDGEGIHIGGSAEKSFGFLVANLVSKMWGIEEFINYWDDSPTVNEKGWDFSFGIGGYAVFGFNIGFSVNLDEVFRRFKKIWGIS